MSRDDLESFLATWSSGDRPRDGETLACELVRGRKLTPWQAQRIYSNKLWWLVLNNYVALDQLGKGEMGTVLLAEHKLMDRQVALKILSSNATRNADALNRFTRELQTIGKLHHQNFVIPYDSDACWGVKFFIMEYVRGSDLATKVKKEGALPVRLAVHCILETARGLEFAHERGMVHRYIKPSHLMLDRIGKIKILDLGLARVHAELSGTNQIIGTVDYIAPEQAMNSNAADGRSDIYSLGATLWFLLTGKPMYDGETVVDKLLAHQNKSIPSLIEERADVSAELDHTFQQMVAKCPESRISTMTALIKSLQDISNRLE